MKINPSVDLVKGQKAESSTPAGSQPNAAGAKTAAPAAESSTIHLSGLSTQLQALASTLAASGEFDTAKVEAIKQAIRDGQLRVNAEVIADKMLTDLREMLVSETKA
jgi:negative regulator of flagellin synthesis FlgM